MVHPRVAACGPRRWSVDKEKGLPYPPSGPSRCCGVSGLCSPYNLRRRRGASAPCGFGAKAGPCGLGGPSRLRGQPYTYMARTVVFVLSSAWDVFRLVLVEAVALGTTVVSTDCPNGPAEILESGKWAG